MKNGCSIACNDFGLGVSATLLEHSILAQTIWWHYAKPVLYEGGISRTTLSPKHVKEKRKNERGKHIKKIILIPF